MNRLVFGIVAGVVAVACVAIDALAKIEQARTTQHLAEEVAELRAERAERDG